MMLYTKPNCGSAVDCACVFARTQPKATDANRRRAELCGLTKTMAKVGDSAKYQMSYKKKKEKAKAFLRLFPPCQHPVGTRRENGSSMFRLSRNQPASTIKRALMANYV